MGTKIVEYVDSTHLYATNYIRNSKAIAVLWAIFTICYSIIVIVSFVTPGKFSIEFQLHHSSNNCFYFTEWVGDLESETGGRIGLWKVCERNELMDSCVGELEDMLEMTSLPFQVA